MNRYFPRQLTTLSAEEIRRFEEQADEQINDLERVDPQDLAILIGLGVLALYSAQLVADYIPYIPKILVLTSLALFLAQWPRIQRLRGIRVVGIFCIYLFLAVIGAYCDLAALVKDGQLALTMLTFVSISVPIHGLFQFGIGGLLQQDWAVLGIASQANIGGSASCLALSKSLNRPDLHLPGILAGALANYLSRPEYSDFYFGQANLHDRRNF